MKRIVTSLVIAAALAVAGTTAFETIVGPQSTAAVAAATKVCKTKTPAGKTKTWRCGADQACCVNKTMGSYVCGIPGLGCL
jgi:hypothetical protein